MNYSVLRQKYLYLLPTIGKHRPILDGKYRLNTTIFNDGTSSGFASSSGSNNSMISSSCVNISVMFKLVAALADIVRVCFSSKLTIQCKSNQVLHILLN